MHTRNSRHARNSRQTSWKDCLPGKAGVLACLILFTAVITAGARQPAVELEEIVTTYEPANNGSSPMWCYGAPLLVRRGSDVFVSAIETGKGVAPLCNTRWQLWHRTEAGWNLAQHEADYRQREPCPLAGFPDGRLFLSVNPSTTPPGTKYGPCTPLVLQFDMKHAARPFQTLSPVWSDGSYFTDHSYRGFAVDAQKTELLLVNINAKTGAQFISWRDANGTWHAKGAVCFPIRACYPQVALENRAAHVLAIGDIVEPVEAWRKFKFENLKRKWDYVFRRLFYVCTPDITRTSFSEPIEIENVDATAGHISNLDLLVDEKGTAHVLYLVRPHQHAFMRDRYFPDDPMSISLVYGTVQDGKVASRKTLIKGVENKPGLHPGWSRFHRTPDGRLFVIMAGTMRDRAGESRTDMWLLEIAPGGAEAIPLRMKYPLATFFTNTPRGGSKPSKTLDLFGVGRPAHTLRYARIRLP